MLPEVVQSMPAKGNPPELKPVRKPLIKQISASKYLLILLLPCIIYYILFAYTPMWGVLISFKNFKLFGGFAASEWVGLKYFEMFLSSPDCFNILRNTFLLGLFTIVWGFPFPLIFALLLNEVKNLKFKKFTQTVSYMPHFLSTVVIIGMVQLFLSPTFGIVNQVMQNMGLEKVVFLQEASFFRTIYVSSGVWQSMGWNAIIYIAALSNVDPNLYEAAMIDGAGRFKRLVYITLPCISPTIITLLLLSTGSILSVGFEKTFLLQNPVIMSTTDVIQTYVWRQGLQRGNISYGTAIGLFNSVINLFFLYISNFLARKFSETSLW